MNHLIDRGYLDQDVRPDSCIINQYGMGDCIPPHVDHESYHRPVDLPWPSPASMIWIFQLQMTVVWTIQ